MSISLKKIIFLVLLLSLISNCAFTSRQKSAQKEMKNSVHLCYSVFLNTDDSTKKSYDQNVYYEFFKPKQNYSKEWERFKKRPRNLANYYSFSEPALTTTVDIMENFNTGLLATFYTVGVLPTIYSVLYITPTIGESRSKTYPELLSYCEKRMQEEQKKEEQEKLEKRETNSKNTLQEVKEFFKKAKQLKEEAKLHFEKAKYYKRISSILESQVNYYRLNSIDVDKNVNIDLHNFLLDDYATTIEEKTEYKDKKNKKSFNKRDIQKVLNRLYSNYGSSLEISEIFILEKAALAGMFDKKDPTIKDDFWLVVELWKECLKISKEKNPLGGRRIEFTRSEINKINDQLVSIKNAYLIGLTKIRDAQ